MTIGKVVFGPLRPNTSWGFIGTHTGLPENFFNEISSKPIKKSSKTQPDPTTIEKFSAHDQEIEKARSWYKLRDSKAYQDAFNRAIGISSDLQIENLNKIIRYIQTLIEEVEDE